MKNIKSTLLSSPRKTLDPKIWLAVGVASFKRHLNNLSRPYLNQSFQYLTRCARKTLLPSNLCLFLSARKGQQILKLSSLLHKEVYKAKVVKAKVHL